MKKRLLLLLILLVAFSLSYGQMDYSEVQFRSYIYKYKEEQPRTSEIGIEKEFLEEIVYLLGKDIYTRQEMEEIVYKTWLAMENPKVFDFVYKDFAVSSNKNWGSENENGEIVLEPNPYLTDWTVSDDEYPYFQLALNKMLINQAYENMGLRTSQMLGTFFDGVTRHTEEALQWTEAIAEQGFKEVIAERDGPWEDYGQRPR